MRYKMVMIVGVFVFASVTNSIRAQKPFTELVGPVSVKPVASQDTLKVPYITWGGDVASFHANGGLDTASGSIFNQANMKVKFTPGDNFVQQVKDYVEGKTPFLRGTMRMLGQASEVIGKDPRTKPVIVMQISWSAGDHIVARKDLKTLNDLKSEDKKVKIACQQGGPHVGLLYDALVAARLKRDDIEIIFVPDLTGENGPAELFRKDNSVDACCVITPDMIGLTGGVDSTGSGAEGTVEGAHVLVSTQQMRRSIADVYAVRADWYQQNKPRVAAFVASHLKAADDLQKMRDNFEKTQRLDAKYRSVLAMSQSVFGEDVLPTLEVDAHGLLLDCTFVGLKGQIAFFEQSGNLSGFNGKMKDALDVAESWGYAKSRRGFDPGGLDYRSVASASGLKYEVPETISEGVTEFPGAGELGSDAIVSFTISFEPNQPDFPIDRYRTDFEHAMRTASTFGGATMVIRGHADPTKTLVTLLKAGQDKGLIRQTGSRSAGYKYFLKTSGGSSELDISQTDAMVKLITSGQFEGQNHKPMQVMQAALNLSHQRAEAVKAALEKMARAENINLNLAQLQPQGVGIADPVISKPTNIEQAKENMRVEFRIIRVDPESTSDFDF